MTKFEEKFLLFAKDYRNWICVVLTLISLSFALFYFVYADERILESLVDIKNCSIFYVNELFELDLSGNLTINELTKLPFEMPWNLPNTWEEFKVLCKDYFQLLISKENLVKYLEWVGDFLYYLSKILIMVMPFVILLITMSNLFGQESNNDYNKNSKALIFYKKLENKVIFPLCRWVKQFILFLKENNIWGKIWLFIWFYNFNFIAVIIEAISYYLYFVASFELTTIYIQVIKLLMDLSIVIDFIPTLGWIIITILIIDAIRKNVGYSRLHHMEMQNRGFINERPIVSMIVGTMGKKKTTIITDMAISQEIMLRDKAFEKILELDLKFPYFPWINFENDLKKAMNNHTVYTLASCERFVESKRRKFYKKPHMRNIFCYNYQKYGLTYNNQLYVEDLWDVLKAYSKLYFLYIIQSSLIISNYSIRVDNVLQDIGNFPLWNSDLFKKDSRYIDAYSRHSHILDFDSLRLGKKVIENSNSSDSFEFGVVNLTEIGKERGNNLELQQVKKNDEHANQKNDLFNSWLKMVRHSATIDNYPFVKVITDDQRPESWGADARDLCEIVHIKKCKDLNISMPLFALEDLIIQGITNKFEEKYYNYRFERGDNTLGIYLLHIFVSWLKKYRTGIYNRFGFYKLKIAVESGVQDGELNKAKYFLMTKKIYSRRFSTDCFSDFFTEKSMRSELGINDLPEFETEKASFNEMMSMHSYFFDDLTKLRKPKD